MRRLRLSRFLSPMVGLLLLYLIGCSSTPGTNSSATSNRSTAPVSLSITDDPPSGVTVLFFQISLTAANLTPAAGSGTVSLLNNNTPIQIDVTQLQAISDFLSTANVTAGTYNSLALTFANPQLVIFNESDQTIASSCPVQTVCQLTPPVDNASMVTFSSTPFPLTLSAGNPLGLLLDFHLNRVIQSDLSVNLGATNGVTIRELPPMPPPGPQPFGFLFGTIQSVNASQNQFTVQTGWGGTFTVDVNSSTTYQNFPSSACSTSEFACVAGGDIVQVQVASVQPDNTLVAASVSYVQAASQQVVQGNVISLSTSSSGTVMTLLLHWSPNLNSLPWGGVAAVTVPSSATFSVDSGNFTIPSGLSFSSASDLLVGQNVQVAVVAGTLSNSGGTHHWTPPSVSFTTNSVELEPSQVSGTITAIDSSASTFTIATFPNFFAPWSNWNSSNPNWTPTQVTVDTTAQTTFQDLSPDSSAGLSTKTVVSVRGWIFATPGAATPSTQAAETVVDRANGYF
jgi:Domain of unknown function (DUF4382)/Domain of unknown function (DUF5666)